MNILLINTNPVVSRLITLCIRDERTVFEEVTDVSAMLLDKYDIVFVDDASYVDEVQNVLEQVRVEKKVFLSSKNLQIDTRNIFDITIDKPFLPSQITALLESIHQTDAVTVEEADDTHFIFPLSSDKDEDEKSIDDNEILLEEEKIDLLDIADISVLDSNEIEKIKALLEEDELEVEPLEIEDEEEYEARKVEVITQKLEADGLEIVHPEEYIASLSKKSKKEKKNKMKMLKKKKKNPKRKEESYTFEEALIAAVEGMKVKKIKKLLKGAEVSIKIHFKDEK